MAKTRLIRLSRPSFWWAVAIVLGVYKWRIFQTEEERNVKHEEGASGCFTWILKPITRLLIALYYWQEEVISLEQDIKSGDYINIVTRNVIETDNLWLLLANKARGEHVDDEKMELEQYAGQDPKPALGWTVYRLIGKGDNKQPWVRISGSGSKIHRKIKKYQKAMKDKTEGKAIEKEAQKVVAVRRRVEELLKESQGSKEKTGVPDHRFE